MYKIRIGEKEFDLRPAKGETTAGTLNDQPYKMDLRPVEGGFHVISHHRSYTVHLASADFSEKTFSLLVNGHEYQLEARDQFDLLLQDLGMEDLAGSAATDLKAPMPGLVLDIRVSAGDAVKKGDPVVVLEAMKMENVLKAEGDAVVKSVNVKKGQAVEKSLVLIEFEA